MNTALDSRPFLSRPGYVTLASLAATTLLVVLLWSPWDRPAGANVKRLHLYCAAAMTKPVAEMIHEYEQAFGVQVTVDYGTSGSLLSKMRTQGSEGDLYLPADGATLLEAKKLGLIQETVPLAILKPTLAVNRKTYQRLMKEGKAIRTAKDLLREDYRLKIVLANTELASISLLTKKVLAPLGIWGQLEKAMRDRSARVSTVGTVQEVAQILQAREDCIGFIWGALAAQSNDLAIIEIPELAGVEELLQIGMMTKTVSKPAALKLARYLAAADRGQVVLRKHRYDSLPDADVWEETPQVHLAVGAMLKPAVEDALRDFERREGVTIRTTYAGCGPLTVMMKGIKTGDNVLPFPDAFFSCDVSFLEQVQDWFEPGQVVASNDIVLVVANDNPHGIKGWDDLARPDLRVGLGHPTKTALGKLTDDILKKLQLHERVYDPERDNPVLHADAGHTLVAQARAGALDVAVVYRSNVLSTPSNVAQHLDLVDVPGNPARQPFAIAKESTRKHLVRRLFHSLLDNADKFRSVGFEWLQGTE